MHATWRQFNIRKMRLYHFEFKIMNNLKYELKEDEKFNT